LPALLAAIRCGKPIYCEKPVVSNAAEAAQIRAALAETGYDAPTQVAFHLRGFAAVRRAKELIAAGRLGRLVRYRIGYYHAGALDASAPFRWKHASQGGTILDLASHLLDLTDYLVGLPAELTATATTLWPTRPVRASRPNETAADVPTRQVEAEDAVSILTRGVAQSGADPRDPAATTGVIEATKLAAGAEDEMTFEIGGTQGAVRFSLMDPHYLEFFDGTKPSGANGGESGWTRIAAGARYEAPECDFPSAKSTTGWLRAHVASLATFYRSVAEGGSFGPDLAQGLRIQDALDAVKRSVANRSWETL
jgi:predicted dehydrogenase